MPEEINRIVTDAISDFLFATEESALQNLKTEGKPDDQVFNVGHVMIDNLFYEIEQLRRSGGQRNAKIEFTEGLEQYGAVTLHRPANVDRPEALREIMGALGTISEELPLIFPIHPRTRSRIDEFEIKVPSGIRLTGTLGYRDFVSIWGDAEVVLTDSGGLQEETTALGVRCVTR